MNGRLCPVGVVTTVVDVTKGTIVVDPCSSWVVVVVLEVVLLAAVVADPGSVVVVVLATGSVVVVSGGPVVDVVVDDGGGVVVVVVEVDVDVDVDVEVEVDVELEVDVDGGEVVVVVGGGTFGPQNCTLEMSGRFLPWPTFGRPAFENVPPYCGGAIVVSTAAGPPFTITAATGSVETHVAPFADGFDSVTTCSLPAGFSNTYLWS